MVTVVVVVHNVDKRSDEILGMTATCLVTMFNTIDVTTEILLYDNGSDDGGKASKLLRNYNAELIRFEHNEPVAKCWNDAIDRGGGDVICLVNNDVIFNQVGWLSVLVAPLRFDNIGATGGHKMSWNDVEFLEGSFLAFNKSTALRIAENGFVFDEQFIFTCEEADWCLRLTKAGYQLVETSIESAGMVTHLHHGTLAWTNEEGGINGRSALEVMHDARLKLCRKHGLTERIND